MSRHAKHVNQSTAVSGSLCCVSHKRAVAGQHVALTLMRLERYAVCRRLHIRHVPEPITSVELRQRVSWPCSARSQRCYTLEAIKMRQQLCSKQCAQILRP